MGKEGNDRVGKRGREGSKRGRGIENRVMVTDRNSERERGSPPPSQWVLSTQSVRGVSVTERTLKKVGFSRAQK